MFLISNFIITYSQKDIRMKQAENSILQQYPNFKSKYFDKIVEIDDRNKNGVSFTRNVYYIYYKSSYISGIYVDLTQNLLSIQKLSNPIDYINDSDEFYKPDRKAKSAEKFVLKTLGEKKKDEILIDNKLLDDATLIIREKLIYYEIEIIATNWDYTCNIDKINGKIYKEVFGEIIQDNE